jgi:hypothetical protein
VSYHSFACLTPLCLHPSRPPPPPLSRHSPVQKQKQRQRLHWYIHPRRPGVFSQPHTRLKHEMVGSECNGPTRNFALPPTCASHLQPPPTSLGCSAIHPWRIHETGSRAWVSSGGVRRSHRVEEHRRVAEAYCGQHCSTFRYVSPHF